MRDQTIKKPSFDWWHRGQVKALLGFTWPERTIIYNYMVNPDKRPKDPEQKAQAVKLVARYILRAQLFYKDIPGADNEDMPINFWQMCRPGY